ncbi:MAG: 4Fe-4S binding protein [Dehalococcoidia bacterium]
MISLGKLRLSVQLLAIVILNLGFTQSFKTGALCPAFFCYGCPWAAFACPIGALQSFTAAGLFPFYAAGTLGVFSLTLGRTWCGWVCPFGTVQDLVSRIRQRGDLVKLPRLPLTKYLSLAAILVAAWLTAETFFCKLCPAGSLFAALPHRFVSSELDFGTFFYVHIATLAVAIFLFVLAGRFWCRYLCPLGAIFGFFNPMAFLKVRIDKHLCTDCGQCLENCPTAISEVEDIGTSSDCIECGECIRDCPSSAIHFSTSLRK